MRPGRHTSGARTPRLALAVAAAALLGSAGCMTTKPDKMPKLKVDPQATDATSGPRMDLPKPSNVDNTPRVGPASAEPKPTAANVRSPEPKPVAGPVGFAPGYEAGSSHAVNGVTSGAGGLTVAAGSLRVPPNNATMGLTPAASSFGDGPTPPPPPAMPAVTATPVEPALAAEPPAAPRKPLPTDRNAGTNASAIAVPTSVGKPTPPEAPRYAESTVMPAVVPIGIPPDSPRR
jgi:hypothetical protein